MDNFTYKGKILSRCSVCHHGKWEGEPCPKESEHARLIQAAYSANNPNRPVSYSSPKRPEPVLITVSEKKKRIADEIYEDLLPNYGKEDARRFADMIAAGYSRMYVKGHGFKPVNGVTVIDIRKKYGID